ncbi:hypothetical protein V6N12_024154 [Hibiscus sabdariffa]|uniref:RNase H type-1 domain-containing protein n=1 Tax=Hibiscus sabdariffa TaxID=183260 RepID=A0ABR2G076_9ROSI
MTNEVRFRRQLTTDCRCSTCGADMESIDRILFCPSAYSLWCSLIRAEFMHEFFQLPFKEWIFVNLTNSGRFSRDGAAWNLLFGYLLWLLWNRRNARVFDVCNLNSDGAELWGIYESLRAAWSVGIRKLVEEVDSLNAIRAIQEGLDGQSAFTPVPYIVELLNHDRSFKLEHIRREGNRLADSLAKLASFDDLLCQHLLAAPACILPVVQSDGHV